MARSHEWQKVRTRAFERDRKKNVPCQICGRQINYALGMSSTKDYNPQAYEPDHILPVDRHPELELDLVNIQAAHAGCNRSKKNKAGINLLGVQSEDW